jgi:DNA-binding MarR family transcriptional regulator
MPLPIPSSPEVTVRRTGVPPTSALDDSVSYLLKRAQMAVSRELHALFGEFDVTAVQYSVLVLADENPGMSQGDLAAALEVERPRMVPVLNRLTARGLTVRRADPQDGRIRRIHLTEAGAELLRELQRRLDAHEHRLAEVLDGDRDRLALGLRRLLDL